MKNGLVLSGGGARGFAHLGVLQALDELDIHIDAMAGTSAGAMACAFYAAGHKPEETLKLIQSYRIYHWIRILWRKPGILNMRKIAEMFSENLPESFEKLKLPLTVTATDIVNGELRYFNSGELVPAICASSCIPIMFEPIKFGGTQFVDGGLLNNFPIEALLGKTENIIGVNVNPIGKTENQIHIKNIMDRSLHLALDKAIRDKEKSCTVFIEPKGCEDFGMLDLTNADKIFKIGYEATMEKKEELLKLK